MMVCAHSNTLCKLDGQAKYKRNHGKYTILEFLWRNYCWRWSFTQRNKNHCVCDTRSVFLLNRINFVENSKLLPSHLHWLHQVWRKIFPTNMLQLLWKILCLIKLFYLFYIILFYLVIPMMLGLDILLRFYVVIEHVIVGRWNRQFYYLFWLLLLWLMLLSLGQMLLSHFIYNVTRPGVIETISLFVIMVHEVTEPCGCQGITRAMVLYGCCLSLSSGDLTNTSSKICGSCYLPIFLFRDGSLILISIVYLMALAIL